MRSKSVGKHLVTSILALAFAGCCIPALRDIDGDGVIRIVAFGDSNTQVGWQPFDNWCEKLQDMVPANWEIVCQTPYGLGGATAIDNPIDWDLSFQVDEALAVGEAFDAAIFAYGTNDMNHDVSTFDILAAYEAARIRLGNRTVFIATTPYRLDHQHATRLLELNVEIRARYSVNEWVNFDSGFDVLDYADNLHLSESGHQKRAENAFYVLTEAACN